MKRDKGQQHIPGGVRLKEAGLLLPWKNSAARAKEKIGFFSETVCIYSHGQSEECEKPGPQPRGPPHICPMLHTLIGITHVNHTMQSTELGDSFSLLHVKV